MQVHDDLDRDFGKQSIKHGGSANGHNGVKSTMGMLQSDTMKRLRVGIGRPNNQNAVTRYVHCVCVCVCLCVCVCVDEQLTAADACSLYFFSRTRLSRCHHPNVFWRARCGILANVSRHGTATVRYVLTDFNRKEKEAFDEMILQPAVDKILQEIESGGGGASGGGAGKKRKQRPTVQKGPNIKNSTATSGWYCER